jgi:hypothetical protein
MTKLHLREEEIWEMTPRKFQALWRCAMEFAKMSSGQDPIEQVKDGYVDQIDW